MSAGDVLARIAESQIGTRGDLQSGRAALYGYLLASDAKFGAFTPAWARPGFGMDPSSRYRLLSQTPGELPASSRLQSFGLESNSQGSPVILRIHSWCAAFVDWCVMQLLLKSPHSTTLPFSGRPKTAAAFELMRWGKSSHCSVFNGAHTAPERGDIVVFSFSHTGIVAQPGRGSFFSVEGNTRPSGGGNQGYVVEKRCRAQGALRGFIRLPSQ